MIRPTTLSQLYPADTPMREVAPEFRGMPWRQWQRLKTAEQCEAHQKANVTAPEDAPLSQQRLWNPRDSYGM